MEITINVHEAKTRLSELLEKVELGNRVIIARAGKPVAELISVQQEMPRQLGILKGKGRVGDAFFEPMTPEELAEWGL